MDPYARLPSKLPFSRATLPKKVILTYIFDYLIVLILVAAFYIIDRIEPFHQRFALANYTLQYPYAEHERVPIPLALLLVIVVPAGIIFFYTIVIDGIFSHHKRPGSRRGPYTIRKRLWELNCGILGLLLASGTAFVITQALKSATGKPRPDFIDRCQPALNATDSSVNAQNGFADADIPRWGLSDDSICTRRDLLKDGFRSWPSGHSSSSFAGLFYLSLYLAGKLHILDSRGFVWKTFLVILPTIGAALIAVSRIMDARHHPFDVITGSALGILCAWVSYRQYFPSLSEPWKKGRAYPIRTWGAPQEPQYVGDGGFRAGVNPMAAPLYATGAGVGDGPSRGGIGLAQTTHYADIDDSSRSSAAGMEPLRNNAAPPGVGIARMNTVPLNDDDGARRRAGAGIAPQSQTIDQNVFREQVALRERARQDELDYQDYYGHHNSDGRRRENWDETSSDEDEGGRADDRERRERGLNSYELQPTGVVSPPVASPMPKPSKIETSAT